MLYREIIAACSQIHTKHINALCGAERGICEYQSGINHNVTIGPEIVNQFSLAASVQRFRTLTSHTPAAQAPQ